jgi:ATP-dependent DNA ligase
MAPTLVREPFHRPGWVYEEKVDGWRILAYKDGQRVRLVSRNERDHTRRFADLAVAISKLSARRWCLTVRWRSTTSSCGPGSSGCASPTRPPSPRRRCSWLSTSCTAMAAISPPRRCVAAEPVRRTSAPAASWCSRFRRLAADGLEAWRQVVERGYEGYVAEDEASAHTSTPTRAWLR